MHESQEQPPADRQAKLTQFAVMMVCLAIAAQGARYVLDAKEVFGTVTGWVMLICCGLGFLAGLAQFWQQRH